MVVKGGINVHKIESAAVTLVMAVLIALGLHLYFVTLPKLDSQLDATHRLSVEAGLTAMESRKLLAEERKTLPVTQAKLNAALDRANTLLATTNGKVAALDTEGMSRETVMSLKAIGAGVATTANSVGEIKDQLVETGNALKTTADATTRTADAATGTANASTDVAKSANKLVGDVSKPVVQSVQNVQSVTGDVKEASADAKTWFHQALHPKWPKVVYGEVKSWGAKILGAWL